MTNLPGTGDLAAFTRSLRTERRFRIAARACAAIAAACVVLYFYVSLLSVTTAFATAWELAKLQATSSSSPPTSSPDPTFGQTILSLAWMLALVGVYLVPPAMMSLIGLWSWGSLMAAAELTAQGRLTLNSGRDAAETRSSASPSIRANLSAADELATAGPKKYHLQGRHPKTGEPVMGSVRARSVAEAVEKARGHGWSDPIDVIGTEP